ncbi:diguanylate cyclase (GGDEF) domain-containing protein [Methylobacterium sp. UNC378MF]|uniref:GGDEF domain-containing protein n=1 Tax=Methylobacterium sp. UNC378MF TaxID=1502748 RepID=UPI0008847972|nr:sensor domain-containing diguanylate cyclase [Methylobacterium sp. UNC378MF]SDA24411.1 diguanylate cyclase (GGDEF) domain-containing protein [Methylobacterium sp. UNC378MF]
MTTERALALVDSPRDRSVGGLSDPSAADEEASGAAAAFALHQAIIRRQAGLLVQQQRALAAAGMGLWSCCLRAGALDWSGSVHDLFGVPRGTTLHRPRILELYEPASRRLLERLRHRAITRSGAFVLDAEVHAGGRPRWIRIRASVETADGRPIRLFGTKQDITEEIARLAELSRRAERDPLTGLANRRGFEAQFEAQFAARTAGSGPDPLGALLLIDLDGFKPVNDVHGHAAGDLCLRRSAARLAAVCRDAALVARIGGDEFAVLLRGPVDPFALVERGRRIIAALNRPIPYRGQGLRIGASVGIAVGNPTCGGRARLFGRADGALYAAKDAGGNAVRIALGGRLATRAPQAAVALEPG